MKPGLFAESTSCLRLRQPDDKCSAVAALAATVSEGSFVRERQFKTVPVSHPGRPPKPLLVDPSEVPRRRLGSDAGRAALLHAVAHIEFNAINLALDAVCRFQEMPDAYYDDWISVAADEARHFQLVTRRLAELGCSYGDFPAHNGLWEMAEKTADSCLVRMALVPRVLEARGLDVTPGMMRRLRQAGDEASAAVLEIILDEEVRHVAIGSRWFVYCCRLEGKEPGTTFLELLKLRYPGAVRGPFNRHARMQAGFTAGEMAALEAV